MSQFALEITDLKKKYDSDVFALKGINLTVQEGDFFALLGPNGAGKSSTIGIIASLVTKTAGKVKIFDIDTDENFPEAKRLLGVVSQEINFNNFEKVIDIVTTQAGFYAFLLRGQCKKLKLLLNALDFGRKEMIKQEHYLEALKED
jgi:ABC-2 type transport system ATP-binding protein